MRLDKGALGAFFHALTSPIWAILFALFALSVMPVSAQFASRNQTLSFPVQPAKTGNYELANTDVSTQIPIRCAATCTVQIDQSTNTYFSPGSSVAITVPPGYAPASITLGASATFAADSPAPRTSTPTITVPAGGIVQLTANAANAYDAKITYGYPLSDMSRDDPNQLPGGSVITSSAWTAVQLTLTSNVSGGPLGTYSTIVEDGTTNYRDINNASFFNTAVSGQGRFIIFVGPTGVGSTRYPAFQIYDGVSNAISLGFNNAASKCSLVGTSSGGTNFLVGARGFPVAGWSSWCKYEIDVNTLTPSIDIAVFINNSASNGPVSYAGDSTSGLALAGIYYGTLAAPTTNIIATSTNDTAAAGNLAQVVSAICPSVASQVPTFTNGSANIVLATNPIAVGCPVNFTTSGSLPTNFSTATNYYVVSLSTLTITVAATPGGTAIVAGSAGSGTQAAIGTGALLSTGAGRNVLGVALTAGNWLCHGNEIVTPASTMTILIRGLSTTSATADVTDPSYMETAASLTSATIEANTFGSKMYSLSGNHEVYLTNKDTFASTATALGNLTCWRPR